MIRVSLAHNYREASTFCCQEAPEPGPDGETVPADVPRLLPLHSLQYRRAI
jgi:hypothetical protein